MFRTFVANLIAPRMARTGFRFSKAFRHGETLAHRIVYALVSTVHANIEADRLANNAQWLKAWKEHTHR